jgi:hypothetical protein
VAELAFGKGQDLGRLYGEYERDAFLVGVPEGSVAGLELPPSVPFAGPCLGQAGKSGFVDDLAGLALDDYVYARVPLVAPGGESATWGFVRRLTAFCSAGPVQKWRASSCHTATSGVTCGRPSARTVVIQNSSAA